MVQHPSLLVDELHDVLDRIRDTSGARAQVLFVYDEPSGLGAAGHLDWIQSAFQGLLASGGRVQVLRAVPDSETEHALLVDQAWTGDAAVVRRSVMRSSTARWRGEASRGSRETIVTLDQLALSADASTHLVMLGHCRPFDSTAERVREWAHAHGVSIDVIDYYPPLPAEITVYRGDVLESRPPDRIRGPNIDELRELLVDLTYQRVADDEARDASTANTILQLSASAQPIELAVTLGASYKQADWRRALQQLASAGSGFLAANPAHRIAVVLEDDSIALPFTHDATRLATVAKALAQRPYFAGQLFHAYRAASRLKWSTDTKHVIVSPMHGVTEPFHVEAFDWLKPQQVQVHLIERTTVDRSHAWNPNAAFLQAERCLVVENDEGVAWPGRRSPVARCDVAHSPLTPRPQGRDPWQ